MLEKIVAYIKIKRALDTLKKDELVARREIISALNSEREKIVTEMIGKYKVKAQTRLTKTIDADALTSVWSSLTDEEKNAIAWKPNLKAREFKKLDSNCILMQTITSKPATPTLTIEEIES